MDRVICVVTIGPILAACETTAESPESGPARSGYGLATSHADNFPATGRYSSNHSAVYDYIIDARLPEHHALIRSWLRQPRISAPAIGTTETTMVPAEVDEACVKDLYASSIAE